MEVCCFLTVRYKVIVERTDIVMKDSSGGSTLLDFAEVDVIVKNKQLSVVKMNFLA